MAKAKTDLNTKTIKELMKMLDDKEKELLDQKISMEQGKSKNVHVKKEIKKQIARIKTTKNAKEIAK